jgi:hypothetical protein
MKKPGGTKVVPELTATLAPIYKKQNDVTKPKDLVKSKLISIVVLVLILARRRGDIIRYRILWAY